MTIIKSMELQLIFDFNSREFYGDAGKDVAYRLRRRSRYHALVLFYFFLCIICLRWPLAQFLLRSRTPLKKMSGICRRLKRRLPKRKLGSATDEEVLSLITRWCWSNIPPKHALLAPPVDLLTPGRLFSVIRRMQQTSYSFSHRFIVP